MADVGNSQTLPYWRLSGFYFFYFAALGAWLPYWSLYLQSLGFSALQIGGLSALVLLTKIIAPNLWGWVADHSQRRMTVIRIGAFASFAIFLGIFIDQRYAWLVVVIFGFSFFWNAILSQFEVITLGHLDTQYHRYSQVRVWGSIGFIASVIGLGLIFDVIAISYLPVFVSLILLGIWASSLMISERGKTENDCDKEAQSFSQILFSTPVLAFFLVCFLLQLSHGPYYTFFSIYLESYGYKRSAIGLLWSLGVAAEVLLFIVMHRVLTRFSLRLILLASLAIAVLRWLLIAYCAENLLILIFAQCMHAATFGSFHAVAIEFIRRYFVGAAAGRGQALYGALSFGAGGAVGSLAGGLLWDYSQTLPFVVAALACGIAYLVAYRFLLRDT